MLRKFQILTLVKNVNKLKKNKPITITAMGLLVSWQIKWQNA